MSDPGRATVTPDHVDTARQLVNEIHAAGPVNVGQLVDLIAQAVADAYYDGYSNGMVAGRRTLAAVVKEALHDEGLL